MGLFNKKKEEPKQEKEIKADAKVAESKTTDKDKKEVPKKKELTPEEKAEKAAVVVQIKLYMNSGKLLVENIQNAESVSVREFAIWKALTSISQAVQASQTASRFIDIFVKQKEKKRIHIPGGR